MLDNLVAFIENFSNATALWWLFHEKTGGGRKFSVTPSDKKRDFYNPWTKTGIFFTNSDTKQDFLLPQTCFFLVTPRQYCLSPRTVFLANFIPSISFCQFCPLGQLFSPILPHRTVYFDNFAPLRHFSKMLPPRTPFQDKKKDFQYPPRTGRFDLPDKKTISSPLFF